MEPAAAGGDFDNVLSKLGLEFGRYQVFIVALLVIPAVTIHPFRNYNFVFLLSEPEHKCELPDTLLSQYPQVNATKCSIVYNDSYSTGCEYGNSFETDVFKTTLVTRYDMFCDRIYKKDIFLSFAMGLAAIGLPACAWIADRFGRRWGYLVQHVSYVVGSLLAIPMPTFETWCVARMVECISSMSTYNVCYVWAMELVGTDHRTTVSITFALMFVFGMVGLGGLAFAFPTWLGLSLATSVPFLPFIALFWICPESPRWLYSEGRIEDAKAVLLKMCKWQGSKYGKEDLDDILDTEKTISQMVPGSASPMGIIRGRRLRIKFACVCFIWIAVAVTYTSMSFNSNNFGINFYAAYCLQAAVEAPAIILCLFVLERFGRIWPLCISCCLGGVACLMGALSEYLPQYCLILFGLLGKFGCCVAYAILYQIANELYPTVVRSFALGCSACIGFTGNVFMPYIVRSAETMKSLPLVIMGATSLLAGLVALALPETKGMHMPESLLDAETHGAVGLDALRANWKRLCGCGKSADEDTSSGEEQAKMLESERIHV